MVEKVLEFPTGYPAPFTTPSEMADLGITTETSGIARALDLHTGKLAQLLLEKFGFKLNREGAKAFLEGLKGSSASKLAAGVVDAVGSLYEFKAKRQRKKTETDILKAEKKKVQAKEGKERQIKQEEIKTERKIARLEVKALRKEDLLRVKGPSLGERAQSVRSIIERFIRRSPERLGQKAIKYEGRAGGHEEKANQFEVLSELLTTFANALRSKGITTESLEKAGEEAKQRLAAANLSLEANTMKTEELVAAITTLEQELARRAGELPVAPITSEIQTK